jgi:hypothetical protein
MHGLPVWCPGSVSLSRLLEVVLLLNDALHEPPEVRVLTDRPFN